jgi:hypothetical protein
MEEVPSEWVFEYYLKLQEKLTGQAVTVLSPFNPRDKRPSMTVRVLDRETGYVFKDFSTGKTGGKVRLVKELFNLSTMGEAAHKIVVDYNEYILVNKEDYSLREFKIQRRYKVSGFVKREWNTLDQKYWTRFHIGSKLLGHYNVFPLESYTMSREEDDGDTQLTIQGKHYIYGYFRSDGTLYKIYQPFVKDHKFIKVREYIQGTDQLTFQKQYLVICSSLKDLMGLAKLGFANVEQVAPDSENTLIPEHVITAYRHKYKSICTVFDNDEAGVAAMKKYKERYGLPAAHLKLEKDLADALAAHGPLKVKEVITPILRKALNT